MKGALAAGVVLTALAPAAVHADGLPVVGLDGNRGVVSADGASRYMTFPNGSGTVISPAARAAHQFDPGVRTARFPAVADWCCR